MKTFPLPTALSKQNSDQENNILKATVELIARFRNKSNFARKTKTKPTFFSTCQKEEPRFLKYLFFATL